MSVGIPMIGDDIFKFWSTLWGDTTPHCAEASRITSVGSTLHNLCAQERFVVTASLVATAAKKLNNWKSPGPDRVHNFWIKHLTSLHDWLVSQIQVTLDNEVPDWLTLGRTVLILKNMAVGAKVVTNF